MIHMQNQVIEWGQGRLEIRLIRQGKGDENTSMYDGLYQWSELCIILTFDSKNGIGIPA